MGTVYFVYSFAVRQCNSLLASYTTGAQADMKATIVDLRYRTKDVLKAVERGEAVTILYRGKEKARLIPAGGERDIPAPQNHEAFGLWKDREDLRDVATHVRKLRELRFGDL